MDVAVGERGAVVQDEGGGSGPVLLDPGVQAEFFPVGEPGRLALHQARPHGKVGFWQQESVF